MLSHSQKLRHKIEVVLPTLMEAARRLHTHPQLAALYPEYLLVTHCMVRATVPLMEHALAQAHRLAAHDPVAAAITPYLEKHIPEEDHAFWVLEDLEELGFDRATQLQRTPPPAVAAMVGAQYYWIFHAHPVALFGYMQVMEGYPPTVEQVDALVARTGHPRAAFRMLARHSHLDLAHRDELHAVLDSLPLTPAQSALIGTSALQSILFGGQAIHDLIDQFEREQMR
jgi:hypothetical protein